MEKEKSTSPARRKLSTVIAIIFCIILIPMLIINCVLIIKSYSNQDDVPQVGGFFPMIVLTDSMYPEIHSGDLIICRSAKPEDIAIGDVICFFDPSGNGETTVTHRVTALTTDENGELAFITKGDANNTNDAEVVPAGNLIGRYKSRIIGLGNFALFLQTKPGLALCVFCPILILVAYDIIRRRLYERKNQDDKEKLMAELEALRAQKQQGEDHSEDHSSDI